MAIKKVAFVLDNLAANQIAYSLIYNSNQFLEKNADVNISIFFVDNMLPCVLPKFARFNITELSSFDGTLIATSFKTALLVKNATRSKRYWYVSDMEWTKGNFTSFDKLNDLFCDQSIVKISRSKDFVQNIPPIKDIQVIEDYNVEELTKL